MFSTGFSWNDLLFLLNGAWITLQLTCWAILLGTFAGLVFGLLRALLPRASLPLAWVLDVFRSVPLLIQFVLFNSLKSIVGLNISAFSVGCIVLGVMKDTALVMWIGIVELLRASQTIVTRIQEPLLVLCIAGLIYYVMSLVVARLGARLERRWQEND